jgi:hypothetical protein
MLKPPVSLDMLFGEWEKDAPVDDTNPHKDIATISVRKCKYQQVLAYHNMKVHLLEKEYKEKRSIKSAYYNGFLNNKEDLETYGYTEPFLVVVGTKDKMQVMLDTDKELNAILLKKISNQEVVDQCREIIKELNSKHFSIKAYMDWRKFIGEE